MFKIPSNCQSKEYPFPTKFGRFYPFSHQHKRPIRRNRVEKYNNELPDLFCLPYMKSDTKIYNNPYLDVEPVDRSENFKDLVLTSRIIKFIDKIKSNPKLSQDKTVLRKIRPEEDYKLRTNLFKSQSTKALKPNLHLEKILPKEDEPSQKEYQRTIFNLYKQNTKPMGFRLKNEIDKNSLINNNGLEYSECDKEKIEKLSCPIEMKQSNYLRNVNNYDIKENYNINSNCFFEFKRKPYIIYDPITDTTKNVQPSNFIQNKWDKTTETFELLKHNLKRKGGLFSEFAQKNKVVFDLRKKERERKLEDEEIKKNEEKKKQN